MNCQNWEGETKRQKSYLLFWNLHRCHLLNEASVLLIKQLFVHAIIPVFAIPWDSILICLTFTRYTLILEVPMVLCYCVLQPASAVFTFCFVKNQAEAQCAKRSLKSSGIASLFLLTPNHI